MDITHLTAAYGPIGIVPLLLALWLFTMAMVERVDGHRFAFSVGELHAHDNMIHAHRGGSLAHSHNAFA